jgi:enoyl-CoA hydratase/carnithine racemase
LTTVLYERRGQIGYITLNRPDRLNAFNDQMTLDLRDALRRFDLDDEAMVAVLHGEGRAFCSGGDVKERQSRPAAELDRQGGAQGWNVGFARLMVESVYWKPIIAACHGYVLGAALGLVLEAELSVAAEGTLFEMTEVNRGLAPGRFWGEMWSRGAGTFANDVTFTGRRFSAEEAHAGGLINRLAPEGQHVEVATSLAEVIASKPPLATRAMVRLSRLAIDKAGREFGDQTEALRLYLTEDFRESVLAHLDRREPNYRGR